MKKNLTYEMAQNSDKLDSLLSKMKKINQFDSNPLLSNNATTLFSS